MDTPTTVPGHRLPACIDACELRAREDSKTERLSWKFASRLPNIGPFVVLCVKTPTAEFVVVSVPARLGGPGGKS